MRPDTKLTEAEMVAELRRAAELLGLGHVEAAHLRLVNAVKDAAWGSPLAAAAAKAANLIHLCDAPKEAHKHLIGVLAAPAPAAGEHNRFPNGRWSS